MKPPVSSAARTTESGAEALKIAPAAGTACSAVGNQAARYSLTLANPTQGVKFVSGGGNSTLISNAATASYNDLVVTMQHRMSGNFSFLANYTWSKCLNIADAQGDIAQTIIENPRNIRMDLGAVRLGLSASVQQHLDSDEPLRCYRVEIGGITIQAYERGALDCALSGNSPQ
jgi:hypothetical protein